MTRCFVADHVTGTFALRRHFPEMKSVISASSGAKADVLLKHGEVVKFGSLSVEARATPGHTNGCMSFVFGNGECRGV